VRVRPEDEPPAPRRKCARQPAGLTQLKKRHDGGHQVLRVAGQAAWQLSEKPRESPPLRAARSAVSGPTVGSRIGVDFSWQPGSRRLIADVTAGAQGQPEWQSGTPRREDVLRMRRRLSPSHDHGVHLPSVKVGCQRPRGQKSTEMKY
jgi:hypothetical protein